MIILTESYINEMENPVAKYKAKKAAEAKAKLKAAEDAEVEKRLGKRPEVLATNSNIKKTAKRMAIVGGAVGAVRGIGVAKDLNRMYPGQGYSSAAGAIGGGAANAIKWGAIGYGGGKIIQKYQKHKQKKYDKKAEAIRASMRNK